MNFNDLQERKKRSKRRWNVIAFVLFCTPLTPLGVGVFIANWLDILPNIGGNLDIKKAVSEVQQDLRNPQPIQNVVQPAQKKTDTGMPGHGALLTAVGAIVAAIFAITGISGLVDVFSEGPTIWNLFWPVVQLAIATSGGVLAAYGNIRRKKKARFEAYMKLIGDKTAVPIHYLADVMGIDYHKVIKDLREMITRGILTPAWLDLKTYRLMRTDYSETQVKEPTEKKEEAVSRNERILRQIRADNDLIADVEVSAKIDRIEDLTRKIFAILDERPEKEAQLYNFMNYYLPTTLKALESYARLEAQGIETAAIKEAKQKINQALDELADGYEKQLDRLFEDDVVDITADIDVMRKMLHKDGLQADEIVAATTGKKGSSFELPK